MCKRIRAFGIIALALLIPILSPVYGNGIANPPKNQAPVALGKIDPVTIGVGPVTVDVSGKFSDVDGDTLYFTAAVSDTAIATVSVDGSKVIIKPGAKAGNTTVTVTATNLWGLRATQNIGVVREENTVLENIACYVLAPIGLVGISLPIFLNFSVNISPNFNINIGPKFKIRKNYMNKPRS